MRAQPVTVVLVLTALMLTQATGAASAAAPAAITGTVENLTGGRGTPVAGQAVTLTTYRDGAEIAKATATTDARGRFSFTVSADPARTYVLNVKYKGGDYDSAQIAFKAGETRRQIRMRVYEPTTDPAILRVSVHHLIVEAGEGALRVTELMVFTNPTDRTYIGARERSDGRRETLVFRLPDGAKDLTLMDGLMECCAFATEQGFIDTMDVKPGMREIAFSYAIPYAHADLTVVRALDYPADTVEVFGAPTARLTAAPLAPQSPVTTEQGTYARFSGRSLARGARLTFTLSGLPVRRTPARRVLAAVFAGVIAAALAYPLLRRRGPSGPAQDAETLIRAIAALDDLHALGELPDADHRRRRARLKARLTEVMAREQT